MAARQKLFKKSFIAIQLCRTKIEQSKDSDKSAAIEMVDVWVENYLSNGKIMIKLVEE